MCLLLAGCNPKKHISDPRIDFLTNDANSEVREFTFQGEFPITGILYENAGNKPKALFYTPYGTIVGLDDAKQSARTFCFQTHDEFGGTNNVHFYLDRINRAYESAEKTFKNLGIKTR